MTLPVAEPRQSLTPLQKLDAIDAALADMHAHLEHLRGMGRIVSPQAGQLLAVCESRAKACRAAIVNAGLLARSKDTAEAGVSTMFRLLGLE